MGLRLARWWNRGNASGGRHVRVMPTASVPGAASTLVSSVSLDPLVTGFAPAPALPPEPLAPPATSPELSPRAAPVTPPATAAPVDPATAGVGLVFADGARVELDADDPRVRTFRAAAAALIEPPAR